MVIDRGGLGEYYDVEGTTWSQPPLLSDPTSQVHVGSRTYELFYDGEAVKTIAWHERGGTYWVENTLTNGLSPQDMAAIAEQTVPVSSRVLDSGGPSTPAATVHSFPLPRRAASTASVTEKLGSVFAFVVLAALVVLSTLLLYRRRELKALREQLGNVRG
jgi:hypothetical protein